MVLIFLMGSSTTGIWGIKIVDFPVFGNKDKLGDLYLIKDSFEYSLLFIFKLRSNITHLSYNLKNKFSQQ